MKLTKTNDSKSVPTNPCTTKGGIFQLFWACDFLAFFDLGREELVRSGHEGAQ